MSNVKSFYCNRLKVEHILYVSSKIGCVVAYLSSGDFSIACNNTVLKSLESRGQYFFGGMASLEITLVSISFIVLPSNGGCRVRHS